MQSVLLFCINMILISFIAVMTILYTPCMNIDSILNYTCNAEFVIVYYFFLYVVYQIFCEQITNKYILNWIVLNKKGKNTDFQNIVRSTKMLNLSRNCVLRNQIYFDKTIITSSKTKRYSSANILSQYGFQVCIYVFTTMTLFLLTGFHWDTEK